MALFDDAFGPPPSIFPSSNDDAVKQAQIKMMLARAGIQPGGGQDSTSLGVPYSERPFSGLPRIPKATMFSTEFPAARPSMPAPELPFMEPPRPAPMTPIKMGSSLGEGVFERGLEELSNKKPDAKASNLDAIRDALAASQNSLAALYNTPMANPTGGSMPKPDGSLQNYRYNLGNIRAGKDEWLGRGEPYKGFVTFSTPFYGARALYKNLYSYVGEKPDMTFAEAIAKYAPKADKNDPVGYANWVAEQSKIPVNTPLRDILNDPKKAGVVMHFMGQMEHGKNLPGEFTPEFLSSVASSVIGERE